MSWHSCPRCTSDCRVTDTRPVAGQKSGAPYVRRSYCCTKGHRFSTAELLVPKESSPAAVTKLASQQWRVQQLVQEMVKLLKELLP